MFTRWCRSGLVLAAMSAALLFWTGWNPPPLTYAAASSCQLIWTHASVPQAGTDDVLQAAYALSADDVWAVGSANGATLTEHWNGTAWSIVPSPNAASGTNTLLAVYGSASNDVWAVGRNRISDTQSRALLLHWDGSAWSLLPEPLPNTNHWLADIAGLSADNVWTVGTYLENNAVNNLVLHWDGSAWTQIAIGIPSQSGVGLDAVGIIDPDDIWAAGAGIYHWNGSAWSMQYDIGIEDLVAVAPNDVWFVGPGINGFIHWNGATWQTFAPGASLYIGNFFALDGAAANDVYAIGSAYAHGSLGVMQHFNGKAWRDIPSPATARNTYLNGVSVVSPAELWVVGSFNSFLPPPQAGSVILHGVMNCDAPPIKAPTLLSPPNHSTIAQLRPILTWRGLKNATYYRVQIRDAIGVYKFKADVIGTQFKTPKLKPHTLYMWRVRACNPAGCGAWSDFFTFTVK